jgi:putative spermidine/putrescine transport system permease protein
MRTKVPGMPLAFRLARFDSRWKPVFVLAIILPLFIGSTVRTVGWMILFAQRGVLDSLAQSLSGGRIDLMYTSAAVIADTLSVNLPFVVLTLQSVFEGIGARLEEPPRGWVRLPARRSGGCCGHWRCRGSASPRPCHSSWAMNASATPALLGGPRFQMMAPLLFRGFNTNNNWPFSAALAFILMGTVLLLTKVANLAIPRRYRA